MAPSTRDEPSPAPTDPRSRQSLERFVRLPPGHPTLQPRQFAGNCLSAIHFDLVRRPRLVWWDPRARPRGIRQAPGRGRYAAPHVRRRICGYGATFIAESDTEAASSTRVCRRIFARLFVTRRAFRDLAAVLAASDGFDPDLRRTDLKKATGGADMNADRFGPVRFRVRALTPRPTARIAAGAKPFVLGGGVLGLVRHRSITGHFQQRGARL